MQTARKGIIKPRKEEGEEQSERWLPLETRGCFFFKGLNLRTSLVSIRGSASGVFVCEGLISSQS